METIRQTIIRIQTDLSLHLKEDYRKIWVEYCSLNKRTAFVFTIFNKGDYILKFFDLQPPLEIFLHDNPSIYNSQLTQIKEFLKEYLNEIN